MRTRVRKFAHFLERIGLAMAGAASGLFVAAHVGSSIAVFPSEGFIVMMMIGGAVGFYLGIDTPALAFHPPYGRPSRGGSSGKVGGDAASAPRGSCRISGTARWL